MKSCSVRFTSRDLKSADRSGYREQRAEGNFQEIKPEVLVTLDQTWDTVQAWIEQAGLGSTSESDRNLFVSTCLQNMNSQHAQTLRCNTENLFSKSPTKFAASARKLEAAGALPVTREHLATTEKQVPAMVGIQSKKDLECHYCHKKGHFARDCRKKPWDESGSKNDNRKGHQPKGGYQYPANKREIKGLIESSLVAPGVLPERELSLGVDVGPAWVVDTPEAVDDPVVRPHVDPKFSPKVEAEREVTLKRLRMGLGKPIPLPRNAVSPAPAKEAARVVGLRRFCAAAYHHLCAVRIQRALRAHWALTAAQRQISSILYIQKSSVSQVSCLTGLLYYNKTIDTVYEVEDSVDTLLDLLQIYREKAGDKVADKGGVISYNVGLGSGIQTKRMTTEGEKKGY
ncbi:hypothetical protein P4O66_001988 [Electrophorus voltai]|uniref:CCHC-type domain-containing protein n=1 Tax=Electrophorus voltai TaxID=2609070 RepID=A0AAD8ZUR8_9TELE|nr:hypothetical protein P4O66_001988 [Electrophorus voltai]